MGMDIETLTLILVVCNVLVTLGGGIKIYVDMCERLTILETKQQIHEDHIRSLRNWRHATIAKRSTDFIPTDNELHGTKS